MVNQVLLNQFNKNCHNINWDFGNEILYEICESNPKHEEVDKIMAKLWLIGRSYSVSMERGSGKKNNSEDFYEKKAEEIVKWNKEVYFDRLLQEIKNKEFNESTINEVLKIHNILTKEFEKISGLNRRSLASKYLHFHLRNLFPIYDSRATESLRLFKLNKVKKENICGDEEYSKFCYQILEIKNYLKESGLNPSLREIDTFLLKIHSGGIKNDKTKLPI